MTEGARGKQPPVRWRMWFAGFAVLVALLGGCAPSNTDEGPSPAVAAGPVLSVSEQTVQAGDVIDLHIKSPEKYTWGLETTLDERHNGKWKTVYYWSTWKDKESRINEPFPPRKPTFFELVGFEGEALLKIRIPDLAPGEYRITKRFTSGPKAGDSTTAEVEIRVVS